MRGKRDGRYLALSTPPAEGEAGDSDWDCEGEERRALPCTLDSSS